MASLTCCLDMHDDIYLGLSVNKQFVLFGVPKKNVNRIQGKSMLKNKKVLRSQETI